jgi:hypothetical protein
MSHIGSCAYRDQAPTNLASGSGGGAKTDLQRDSIGKNEALSNRDKSEQSRAYGRDRKWAQSDQLQDHAANKECGLLSAHGLSENRCPLFRITR